MRAYENEPVVIMREVDAVMVPSGQPIRLKMGLAGYITQALGGSFTLYIEGNLYRLSGEQADAIGKEVVRAPELPPNATEEDVRELAWQQMRGCYDPEIPINIVDLGLVYDCRVQVNEDQTRRIDVVMTLTAPGCGMGDVLVQDVKEKLAAIPTVTDVGVELTFEPPWSQSMMSEAARLQTGMTW
ncbi:MAG TPA: putative Fe-S cluster assembly protein SufT [Steroidobacteraceae bacterium]|nr:putative Fe-S cluster assembly protein SufT [Steroidobacteraceae bacterium]